MESMMKERRGDNASVLDLDPKSTVGGGVEDMYGEDRATEEQLVTPWTVSVARSNSLNLIALVTSILSFVSCFFF